MSRREKAYEYIPVILNLVEIGHARARGDLLQVTAACRRIPQDPTTLAALGLAAWDVIPLMVLGNAGTAAFWTGDLVEAEKHLQAAVDIGRSGGLLRPHLNAAAHLALLHCDQGDLDVAQDQARAVVERATDAGWTVSAQVAAAYLTLAWVALDRDDRPEADGWLARVAEVEAVIAEPHVPRHRATGLLGRIRGGKSATGPVGTWVATHVRGLRIGAVALAALLFVFLPQPTGAAILLIAVGLLVGLAGIEFLAPVSDPDHPPTSAGAPA